MVNETIETLIGKFENKNDPNIRKTAEEMDEMRQKTLAYEYLCHLAEAKVWLEACLKEKLPPTTELEENLRNGVYLAKLGNFIAPDIVPKQKIYDIDQKRFNTAGLQFRHTDNINMWLQVLKTTELPITFQPETTDVYDKKNMPRVIYCIHALSTHLFKLGRAPLIQDLFGKVQFTDEEIDKVRKELQKYGITMPAFQKIGGLLSSNIAADAASVHAAIIHLNRVIDTDEEITNALLNPEVKLNYVYPPYENTYKTVLRQAKMEKIRATQNRSLNDSYVPDVYDELLTQVEVQGHITNINYKNTWKAFMEATKENSLTKMKKLFQMEWMKKYNYTPANLDFYCDLIGHLYDSRYEFDIGSVIDWQKIFESIINEGNKRASDHSEHKDAIKAVNAALDRGGVEDLYRALTNPHLEINANIDKSAMPLFYEEMKIDKNECEKDINESEIAASVIVLSSIAAISRAVERGDENIIWTALNSEHAHLQNLRVHCRQRYAAALFSALKVKSVHETLCPLLTYLDIQECIDEVNAQSDNNEELIATLNNINKTVQGADNKKLLALLKNPKLNLNVQIHNDEIDLYMRLMKMCRKKKGGSDLWLDDIKSIAAEVSREALDIREWTITLVEINIAMSKSDSDGLIRTLMEKDFRIMNTSEDDKALYFQTFSDYFKKKNKYVCPWVVCHTTQGNTAYIDIESSTHSWVTPKDFVPHSRYLSKKDIDSILRKLDRQFNARTDQELRENIVIKLQACARGYLVRRSLQARRNYLQTKIKAIIKIQAWWRSVAVQKKYGKIIKMKTIERLVQQMKKKDPWSWYRIQESKIILIQALWRGRRARRAFLALFHNKNPPYKVVKMFIPILDFSTQDYEKELELQTLKSQVVQAIRKNQQLSKQLDSMDVKIGLLVQNRITLQDVVAHGVRLNDLLKQNSVPKIPSQKNQLNEVLNPCTAVKGLKSLTKESKRLLDGYQHLFYELQTNPVYLSKLLFCVPQNKANQFLQNVILTIYNFGANTRDEYLLMKLFRHTLEEEIKCKVTKPFDIISNNPIVLKMAVSHSRQMNGLASLRAIVGPLVEKMINDKDLNIETGPVEIYKAWRNESEMKTGQMSPLPYCVTQDEALKYPEVRDRLEKGLTKLKEIVTAFLTKISDSVELMPFCILYMARVLHRTLSLKFPNAPEKELLKVVGNLVYYQFLNAAIVAPDAFHVVNLQHDLSLTTDQRRNLASVAKILHFAAAKKGFGDESAHLKSLNTFIIDCHEKMKSFFRHCCEGPTLEQYYSVDEYTEVTMLHKPYIYISIQEIVDTHSLLVEYQDIIASNPHDKLHSLLDELGPVPTAADLASRSRESLASAEAHARLDVCLALVDKFQTPDDDTTDINKLFIKAKELCVSVMPFLSGEHLLEALCIGTTKAQQENYASWIQRRLYSGAIRADEVITLRDHISLLRKYLDRLEEEGYVNREDGYQSIVTSIALDLCNKGKYRQAQRQALQTLRRTKRSLNEKTKFYQDQCHYYDQYIKKCLENLNAGKRSVHMCLRKARKNQGKLKSKLTVKYSGAKLHEKGVLLEIDGLPNSQFKNVQFEITPSDVNGVFTVQGKFLGIEVEKIDIDIQELLQRQYEGSTVMDLFGKAKVNVNLLLFLLNSKFYGKH